MSFAPDSDDPLPTPSSCDVAEDFIAGSGWEYVRASDDEVVFQVPGNVRDYDMILSWYAGEDMLRLVCTYPFALMSESRLPSLHDLLNRANDLVWAGAFAYRVAAQQMVWRYGVLLPGGRIVGDEQVERMIMNACNACERFYPAFALGTWSDTSPAEAMKTALAEAYGRA